MDNIEQLVVNDIDNRAVYCTLFDSNYLPHVLTLIKSLDSFGGHYLIYCFCMDKASYDYFISNVSNKSVIPVDIFKVEQLYPELEIAKANRTRVEYYFTCSSIICSYVFEVFPASKMVTYLDSDLFFYSSPTPIYDELEGYSVGIIEHKFYGIGKRYLKYGRFNVGWVSFRNDKSGRECLTNWKNDCLNWCYDRLEDGKFGDQKYLDYWQVNHTGVRVIKNIGANVAPWNVGQYNLSIGTDNVVYINNSKLIFFHFASLKQVDDDTYDTNLSRFLVRADGVLKTNIYNPYIVILRKFSTNLGIRQLVKDRCEQKATFSFSTVTAFTRNLRSFFFNDLIKLND